MDFDAFLCDYEEFLHESQSLFSPAPQHASNMQGAFSLSDLSTSFSFASQDFVSQMKDFIEQDDGFNKIIQESGLSQDDKLSPEFLNSLIASRPRLLDMLRAQEINAHENFHALQAFSLSSVKDLIQAFQRIASARIDVAVYALGSGLTMQLGKPLFAVAESASKEGRRLIQRCAMNISPSMELIRRARRSNEEGLSAIHIIEGSAYAAQSIACKSHEYQLFGKNNNNIYSAAWNCWENYGGSDKLCFLLSADLALRFGNLHPIAPESDRPENIFIALAKAAEAIEAEAEAEFNDLSPRIFNTFRPRPFGLPLKADDLPSYLKPKGMVKIASDELRMQEGGTPSDSDIDGMINLSRHLYYRLPHGIREKFNEVNFEAFTRNNDQTYMNAIGSKIYANAPAIGTQKYLLHWLLSPKTRNAFDYFVSDASHDGDDETIPVFSVKLSIIHYRVLSELIRSLEGILLYSRDRNEQLPLCCDVHGIHDDIYDLLDCEEGDSINAMLERNFGRGLRQIIDGF